MKIDWCCCNSHVSCVVFWDAVFRPLVCLGSSLYKYRYDRGEMSLRVTKIIPGTNDHISICLIYYRARINNVSTVDSVAVLLEGTKARQLRQKQVQAVTTYHHVNLSILCRDIKRRRYIYTSSCTIRVVPNY